MHHVINMFQCVGNYFKQDFVQLTLGTHACAGNQ